MCLAASAARAQESASDSLTRELEEIVVTANQPVTKLKGTALVSTIAGSSLRDLGTCLDVLAQLPMLSVADGVVSVAGKGTPEVYIDGRSMRDADELQILQSDNILTVELELAPGAMYAGDTTSVLKITTRRRFIDGLSLTERAELDAGRRLSANNMLDISYRLGSWDLFATGTVADNNSLISGSTTNTLRYEGAPVIVGSSRHSVYSTTALPVKAGFNFARREQSVGAYYSYNSEYGSLTNSGKEWLGDSPRIGREIRRRTRSGTHNVSTYYDGTFRSRLHLHFDGGFRRSLSTSHVATTYPEAASPDVASDDHSATTLWAARLYLSLPLWKGTLTAGTQDSYTTASLDYRMRNHDVVQYIPSSLTEARQTSAAIFASWDRTFGPLSLSAGLRYEYVDYLFKVDGRRSPDMSRTDHLFTPDLSLGWTFGRGAQLSASYRMSVIRPPYAQLTGSLNYVGRHEIEGGNPALRDERMHDIQLFGSWCDFMIQADYTRSIDTYAFVKRLHPANSLQLLLQPVNINVSAIDLYMMWNKSVGIWMPNYTVGLHRQWLGFNGVRYNRPILSYSLANVIALPRDFT
ncbi:MAG: TonB-dependent receptor, partial [Muribaculaceae bacterium]|nr:TonB-dependent receptor [Muribaculaceae bacterium]